MAPVPPAVQAPNSNHWLSLLFFPHSFKFNITHQDEGDGLIRDVSVLPSSPLIRFFFILNMRSNNNRPAAEVVSAHVFGTAATSGRCVCEGVVRSNTDVEAGPSANSNKVTWMK